MKSGLCVICLVSILCLSLVSCCIRNQTYEPNVSFTCIVQAEMEVLYEIYLDGKFVSSSKTFPPGKGLMQSIELTATPGDHVLMVTAPGCEKWKKTVTIVSKTSSTKSGPSFRIDLQLAQ